MDSCKCREDFVSKMNLQRRESGCVITKFLGSSAFLVFRLLNMLSSAEKYFGTWKELDMLDFDFCSEWLNLEVLAAVDLETFSLKKLTN